MKASELVPLFFIVGVKDFKTTPEIQSFLNEFKVPGLALFNSPFDSPLNIWSDPEVALEAIYEFNKKITPQTSFLAVDQEGGRVRRLRRPFVQLPTAQDIGKAFLQGKATQIEKLYQIAAEQMSLSQIGLNFAPVCDLQYIDGNNVIGDRAFSTDSKTAESCIEIFCKAFAKFGVKTTLKHFPGHGPSAFDSHQQIAELYKTKEELFDLDTRIFVNQGKNADCIMTAHISFKESPNIILSLNKEFLNESKTLLGPNKIWITDDLLSMKAVSERHPWLDTFSAGYDYSLICGDLDQAAIAIEETIRHVESSGIAFDEEEALIKRAHKNISFLRNPQHNLNFKIWRSKIMDLYNESESLVNEIKNS